MKPEKMYGMVKYKMRLYNNSNTMGLFTHDCVEDTAMHLVLYGCPSNLFAVEALMVGVHEAKSPHAHLDNFLSEQVRKKSSKLTCAW
jgi:hypothetical protein